MNILEKIKALRGVGYRKLKEATSERKIELPGFIIRKVTKMQELPKFDDITKTNVTYPILEPFAYVNIKWDDSQKILTYNVIEPQLNEEEKKNIERISKALIEMVEVGFEEIKEEKKAIEYIKQNVDKIIKDFGIKLSANSYLKIMYYIYRNFIGYNEIHVILNDPYIEDISCDGINIPVYVIHRKYGSLKTNVVFTDGETLRKFIVKLAERCGRYVSYAEPILDASLSDGSRVAATIASDVATKGGTFCIKEGYIQLADGRIKEISSLFEEAKSSYGAKFENGNEIVEVRDLEVIGVDERSLKQEKSKVISIIKLAPPEKLVDIRLKDGGEITVTPNHIFHVFDKKTQKLSLCEAEKLEKENYLLLPTEVKVLNGKIQKIDVESLLKEFSTFNKICVKPSRKIKSLITNFLNSHKNEKGIDRKYLSKRFKVSPGYFSDIINKNNSIAFNIFLDITKEMEVKLEDLQPLEIVVFGGGQKGSQKKIRIPFFVDENLAYLAGILISDGHLSKNRIDISCYSFLLENKIKKIFNQLFKKKVTGSERIYISNKFLPFFFNRVFQIPIGKKANIVSVPEIICKSPLPIISSFIRGLFDGGGTVNSGLSYTTASKNLAHQLTFLLARFGIYSVVRKEDKKYRILIPSEYEELFLNKIGFTSKKSIKILMRRIKLRKQKLYHRKKNHSLIPCNRLLIELIKTAGIKIGEIVKRFKIGSASLYSNKISKQLLKYILAYIEENGKLNKRAKELLKNLKILANSNQEFVEIEEVKVKYNEERAPVYDIQLNPHRFFIGGANKPMNLFDTIRKFTEKPFSPIDQIELKTTNEEILAYIWYLLEHRASLLVVGGTATGKTSFLNSICMFIKPEAKIVSIEDTRELRLTHEHWIPGLARPGFGIPLPTGERYGSVTLFDLLKEAFRQNPDYVIVGEVRGQEAYVLFQGIASGHASLSTLHAGSASDVVKRLVSPPIELPPVLLEGLDAIIVMTFAKEKGGSSRRVKEIEEVISVDEKGNVKTNLVYRWNPATDTFEKVNESFRLKKIASYIGVSYENVLEDIERRKKFLRWLLSQGIKDYLEVTKYINEFYKNPKKFEEIIGKVSVEKMEVKEEKEIKVEEKPKRRYSSILSLLGLKYMKEENK
jgi:type IV secretory pathway ATPase VirB11/archaellum biosynthesis ATPase